MPQNQIAEQILRWQQLPAAMTALVLQHLPLQDRLAAARVCQTWAEAAALATSTIKLTALPAPKLRRLQSWLQQHGQQLTCLELDTEGAADNAVLQLPELHQLCSLMLTGCKLQLPSAARRSARSAAHPPAALLLPRLTSLHLGGFTVSTPSTLLQLTQVTSLQSLKLGAPYTSKAEISLTPKLQQQPKPISQALSTVLQHNTQLTQLYVWGLIFEDSTLAAVSSLQQLQDCCVGIKDFDALLSYFEPASTGPSGDLLRGLPASLTSLHVRDCRFSDATGITLPRQPPQLTALKQLKLQNARIYPSALTAMLQLQELRLICCFQAGGAGAGVNESSQAVAAFLAALEQMQQLEVLEVRGGRLSLTCPDLPAQSYSALTASTRLRHLDLCVENAAPVPLGAVQHMFPAGKQLPQLTYVSMQGMAEYHTDTPCMTAAELASLISCCPALHTLHVCNTLEPSADVSDLLQLPPCCTRLMVGGSGFCDAAAGVVCQLSQLQELDWCDSEGLTDRGVEKLTALTGLLELNLWNNPVLSDCITDAVEDEEDEDALHLRAKAEGGSPVWQQLRQLCDQSPLCAPARLQEVNRELQQLQAEVAALRQRNGHLEQQVAQLQGQRQQQ